MICRYLLRETLSILGMAVVLFWPAGTLDWWPAWGALAVSLGWLAGTGFVIIRLHPDLLAERLERRTGAKRWDTAIVGLIGLVTLIRYIVAGLDQRYGWSSGFSPAARLIALAAGALGYGLFVWATAANAFFSQVVRIQTERGHTVATGGPYRFVRHPAYLGVIAYEAAVSVLLGSWPALALSAVSVAMLVARTALEDRALRAELPGYADYAVRVRSRLLPGIW
ncbi:MAG TPA: isoprenylcysteine carboxylmethyltransferase family protein [Thermoflexales bacterium]|nr:isoprenylcysteine carboxylmethyltransferase family protein [Thermoflexales bacterium]